MYQALPMSYAHEGDRNVIIRGIYDRNRLEKYMENYMKIYQLLMYGSIFVGILLSIKKEPDPFRNVLLIAGFGYFLFSIIWEAKTRYVFPTILLLTPNMAIMVGMISDTVGKLFRKSQKEQPDNEQTSKTEIG